MVTSQEEDLSSDSQSTNNNMNNKSNSVAAPFRRTATTGSMERPSAQSSLATTATRAATHSNNTMDVSAGSIDVPTSTGSGNEDEEESPRSALSRSLTGDLDDIVNSVARRTTTTRRSPIRRGQRVVRLPADYHV